MLLSLDSELKITDWLITCIDSHIHVLQECAQSAKISKWITHKTALYYTQRGREHIWSLLHDTRMPVSQAQISGRPFGEHIVLCGMLQRCESSRLCEDTQLRKVHGHMKQPPMSNSSLAKLYGDVISFSLLLKFFHKCKLTSDGVWKRRDYRNLLDLVQFVLGKFAFTNQ